MIGRVLASSPALRKLTLALHIAVSVGWLGALTSYIALDLTAATSRDLQLLRGSYLAMDLIVSYAIVPLAIGGLLTGLLVSVGTHWGLVSHWWVLISLLLTVVATVVLLLETPTVAHMAAIAADPAASAEQLASLGGTLVHSVGGALMLLVVLVLNVYKPSGLTPYGWRRSQERRSSRSG